MQRRIDRRGFLGSVGAVLGLASQSAKVALADLKRRLTIGHTLRRSGKLIHLCFPKLTQAG